MRKLLLIFIGVFIYGFLLLWPLFLAIYMVGEFNLSLWVAIPLTVGCYVLSPLLLNLAVLITVSLTNLLFGILGLFISGPKK